MSKTEALKMGKKKFVSEKVRLMKQMEKLGKKSSKKKLAGTKVIVDRSRVNDITCPCCGMPCEMKKQLKAHLKQKHPFKCSYCNKDFVDKASSTEHYWTVHMPGHRYCACCDVRCGSLYIYNLHMASKRHMKTTTAKGFNTTCR
ncbi:zinc finger protein 64-like [Mya arenaria]|uniref:zinc finger protein 64-like n=1 Tax=Mya arenaria TaxID=6604 RepID=UPI0022DF2A89|nr:zinc finger protein 64-like [Mya arenaria]